jgi:very-short-patch-repair endonuclease
MGNIFAGEGYQRHRDPTEDNNQAEEEFRKAWKKLPLNNIDLVYQKAEGKYRLRFDYQWRWDYYIDFVHMQTRTAIEIDGGYHDTKAQQAKDKSREIKLRQIGGWEPLRFEAYEVMQDADWCAQVALYSIQHYLRYGVRLPREQIALFIRPLRCQSVPIAPGSWMPPHLARPKSHVGCIIGIVALIAVFLYPILLVTHPTTIVPRTEPFSPVGQTDWNNQLTPTPTLAYASDGTITLKKTLTCGGCNDPIRLTINTITIDSAHGRMSWNITAYNNTGQSKDYAFDDFSLQAATDDNTVEGTGKFMASSCCPLGIGISLNSEAQQTGDIVFSFVPQHKMSYTLTATIIVDETQRIRFDPVQVAL